MMVIAMPMARNARITAPRSVNLRRERDKKEWVKTAARLAPDAVGEAATSVSYTHLTLPTKRIV